MAQSRSQSSVSFSGSSRSAPKSIIRRTIGMHPVGQGPYQGRALRITNIEGVKQSVEAGVQLFIGLGDGVQVSVHVRLVQVVPHV
jgi:hypothetical protein